MSDIISHIGNTIFGMYQRQFSNDWDVRLDEAITHGEVIKAGEHTIEIMHGNDLLSIWIENRWYAFGHLFYANGKFVERNIQFRPRFKTMKRLWSLYQRERAEFLEGEYKNLFNNTPAR
ncbi:hypothetical protein [Enterobacter roggenkampii]|uniref:hypothetical protein n=1 Tax=Enterobacter roggenkampii TaxID=1812935 RepID=UPI0039C01D3A